MSSTELVTLEQVEDVLLHGGDLQLIAPDAVQEDMVRRILEAAGIEGAFQDFQATPAKSIEGVLVDVKGVAWMKSAYKDGPQVYALLDCTLVESGVTATVSMGGRTTMASFLWAQRHEAMPIRGSFVSSRSNTDPEKMYWTFKLA